MSGNHAFEYDLDNSGRVVAVRQGAVHELRVERNAADGVPRLANRVLGLAALCATSSWATTLTLDFVDMHGQRAEVAKAELLLVAWGETGRLELGTAGSRLTLVLEPGWLRSRWPRFDDQLGVYLHLQAPPLAAIRSNRFRWPVDEDAGATIHFPGNRGVAVTGGEDARVRLTFRPTVPRRVRIVDPHGMPAAGGRVDVAMFWSESNHCGHLAGADPLGSFTPDADGWIEVPDGDFEHVLSLVGARWRNHVFANAHAIGSRLIIRLGEPATEVVVRELAARRVDMLVRRDAEPAAGVMLRGYLADCCGACAGTLSTANERGRIRLDAFRSERYSSVWLEDDDGDRWSTAPALWSSDLVEVDLLSRAADAKGNRIRPLGSAEMNSAMPDSDPFGTTGLRRPARTEEVMCVESARH